MFLRPCKSRIFSPWRTKELFLPIMSLLLALSSFPRSEAGADPSNVNAGGKTGEFSVNLVIDGMSEETEDSGAVIRINADFDEKNRNAQGNPMADYQPDEREGHRILDNDPNLVDGSLAIEASGSGRWRLIFPENIKVWVKGDSSKYEELDTSWSFRGTEAPISCELKVEGIKGSRLTNDVKISAEFAPAESDETYRDSAFLTVLETQFVLTFDDGPLPEKTDKILSALDSLYHNGEPVRVAFFQRAPKIGQFPELTRFVDEKGHLVFNRALELERRTRKTTKAKEIEQNMLRWEEEIFRALGKTPERMIRARYLKKGDRFEKEVQKIGARICGGELTFDFRSSSEDKVKRMTAEILQGWNTKENPRLHPYPAILIFHEFPEVTYNHIGEILSYLQDLGFVLINFDPDLIY